MKAASVLLFLAIFVASGCSTVKKSHMYEPVQIDINTKMSADIDVDVTKKLSGIATARYLFGFIKVSGSSTYMDGYGGKGKIGKVKSAAAYKAIKMGDGDVLVSPQYIVTTHTNFFLQTIRAEVTGFDGKITAIRNLPPLKEDTDIDQ
ncbi:MAG: hypothetical protein RQ754_13225 [Desulfuromonadales bacterium]|jgi:hypothetical protein|nr:hypothetical protein [Desulfuromonadales bacterium]